MKAFRIYSKGKLLWQSEFIYKDINTAEIAGTNYCFDKYPKIACTIEVI